MKNKKSGDPLSLRSSTLVWVAVSALSWGGIIWTVSALVEPLGLGGGDDVEVIAMEEPTADELAEILGIMPAAGPRMSEPPVGNCVCESAARIELGEAPVF